MLEIYMRYSPILDLKVNTLSGKRIGFLRASARYFSKILSRLIFMIGFLMVAFTKKNKASMIKLLKR